MILVDYTGIATAAILAHRDNDLDDINLFRYVILNVLRSFNKRFSSIYGKMVLCSDSVNPWRRDFYPYYKATRKKAKDESPINWNKLNNNMMIIFEEIKNNLPYKCLSYERTEADDILAILALNETNQKNLIITNDKDMNQLKIMSNNEVYHHTKDSFSKIEDPNRFLFEHIIKGDVSDGVCSIRNEPDCFVKKQRQKSIFSKEIDRWYSEGIPEELKENFERNKKVISLFEIPESITDNVLEIYKNYKENNRSKILPYFVKYKLRNLLEDIQDF